MTQAMDQHLARVLERLGDVSRALRWKQATDAGLSALQLRILGFIAAHPERAIGVAVLAQELELGRPTVSESVKTLVDQRYLERQPDATDGRSHTLRLRANGRAHAQDDTPLTSAMARLSPARKNALLLSSMHLLQVLVESGGVQLQRMCWTCRHYSGDHEKRHHCALLAKLLSIPELRTDCPEHELAARNARSRHQVP